MNWIMTNWVSIMAAVGCLVSAASIIVKLTPSTEDDAILGKIVKVLDYLSVVNPKKPE
jgi:hypothetical protein